MLMVIFIFLIPFCVSAIYNFFYGMHINKQINENKKSSWISPISVFFIIVLIEFLIVLILFKLFSVNNSFIEQNYQTTVNNKLENRIYTESEIYKSIYSIFNGNDVNGYIKSIGEYGNFNYILYTCDYKINSYPKYVLITDYIGDKDCISKETIAIITYSYYDGSMIDAETTGLNDNVENSNRIYYIIDPGDFQTTNIKMFLFDKEQNNRFFSNEEFNDFEKREKAIRESAAEEFSITL